MSAADHRSLARARLQKRLSAALRIGFAIAMFGAAAWVIMHELQGQSLSAIGKALRATAPVAIAWSLAFTVISYVGLAASEWWAIRIIGKRLDFGRLMAVTVASYSTSNALGFSLATGGAVRFRLFTHWGFRRADVAAITFLGGLAVTLAGVVSAGLAILVSGDLPVWLYWLGAALLLPGLMWLIPPPPNIPFFKTYQLTPLPIPEGLATLFGAIVDWVFSGLALFVLLPNADIAHVAPFLAVFIAGSLVSAASGVPGGIGVFEAVVLTLSKHFALGAETAAALLLYRILYAVGPFLLSALGMALHQAHFSANGGRIGRD